MVKTWIVLIFTASLSLYSGDLKAEQTMPETTLRGPILATYSYAFREYVIEDVGTGYVWHYPQFAEGNWYDVDPIGWSYDGCNIVAGKAVGEEKHWQYFLLPIATFIAKQIPVTGIPYWSPSGKSVIFYDYLADAETSTLVLTDADFQNAEMILSIPKWLRIAGWLSDSQFVFFKNDGTPFIWDKTERTVQRFGTVNYPPFGNPPGTVNDLFRSYISPNWEMLAEGTPTEWNAEPGNDTPLIPGDPGFDLYFLNEGTQRHVDVEGKPVLNIQWSPSSDRALIIPEPDWITHPSDTNEKPPPHPEIYDVKSDSLSQISSFSVLFNGTEGAGITRSTWSPDERWLAVQTAEYGAVIYNLDTQQLVKLKFDDQYGNYSPSYEPLYWSPVMDYTNRPCES